MAQEEIVLGRVGHYHVPNSDSGYCQTALVVDAAEDVGSEESHLDEVNLVAWTHEGEQGRHLGVPVIATGSDQASFHLTRDCAWSR